jgi:hypothetical protein
MPPGPVFFLLPGWQLAKISILVAVVFASPLMVIGDLRIVPDMIVAVVGVIDPVVMWMSASRPQYGTRQGAGQEE